MAVRRGEHPQRRAADAPPPDARRREVALPRPRPLPGPSSESIGSLTEPLLLSGARSGS